MRRIATLGVALLLVSGIAFADGPAARPLTGRALVEAAYLQRRAPSMRTALQITLLEAGGKQWVRKAMLISKQRELANQMQVFSFVDPPALAGSAVLTRELPGSAPAQWVYIPAYHAARRVASANIGEAYLGTDYFFEDVLDKRWEEYEFKDLGVEQVGGARLTKVEVRPKSAELKQNSSYSRTVYWLEPTRRVIVKEEYFHKDGALLKVLTNSSLKEYGKYLLWDAAVMENVRTKHRTVTQVTSREVELPLADDLFTERALKRAR